MDENVLNISVFSGLLTYCKQTKNAFLAKVVYQTLSIFVKELQKKMT